MKSAFLIFFLVIVNFTFSQDVSLPDDYPADIPVLKGAVVKSSTYNPSVKETTVMFESYSKYLNAILDFDEEIVKNGYSKIQGDISGNFGIWEWKNKERYVNISLSWDEKKKTSTIVLSYRPV